MASVLLIVLLELGLDRDTTWVLRALAAAALAVGWALPAIAPQWTAPLWLFAAPIAPAIVGRLSHREGPVVDLVWMSGLAASLVRMTDWSRWELPAGWRPLVGGWALTLSLAWPVVALRELGFDPRVVTDTGTVNSWAMLTAPQVFAWVLYVALAQLLGALWLDTVMARIARDQRELRATLLALACGVSLASLVAIYQGLVRLTFLSTPIWASLHRATGTMLDANAYGVVAAIVAPLAVVAARQWPHRRATTVGVVLLAINIGGMWMSGSRTALLCAVGGLAGLVAAALVLHGTRARRVLPATIVLAVIVMMAVASGSKAVGPLRRLHELPQSVRSAMSSLWTRGGYGTVAVDMIREHPLTGVGLGTYNVLAPDYWHARTGNALPFDNAQNWWRHQAAELGILGGAAIILWSVTAGWVLLFGHVQPERRFIAIALRGIAAGVAACSMLGMPTQSPLVLLAFLLVVGSLASSLVAPDLRVLRRHDTAAWVIVALLAVAYAAGHVWLGRRSLSVVARAERSGREYVVGAYPAERLPGANEFRWTSGTATFIWPVRPGVLVLHLWAGEPDIERRPVEVSIATPCGVVFDGALPDANRPVELAFRVPDGQRTVAATVRVSRTWRPAQVIRGSTDRRTLGAAVWKDWIRPEDANRVPVRPLPACPVGSSPGGLL